MKYLCEILFNGQNEETRSFYGNCAVTESIVLPYVLAVREEQQQDEVHREGKRNRRRTN